MEIYRGNVDANYHRAVQYAEVVLRGAKDWQDAQHALADHPVHGTWISGQSADDEDSIALCQQIIRDAEENLGDDLPY